MMSLDDDPRLAATLARLHAASLAQDAATAAYLAGAGARSTVGTEAELGDGRDFWRDKFVALEPDKARLCYALCRALDATYVVEAGTSFGVSTLYLAAAVRDNGGGRVIGTEQEAGKAVAARAHFAEAGLDSFIELREGDVRETLADLAWPVDFLLLDIWTPMARPVIELVAPRMRTGAVVVTDNTRRRRAEYADLFAFLGDPANGFSTMTLPFDGGLELSVKVD